MGTRAHLLSSLAALAAVALAGVAAWVVGPALTAPPAPRAMGATGGAATDPDWWHQRGPTCNPSTRHESAGFPTDPVGSSVPVSRLRSLPTYPGASTGPLTGGDETRQWLVGGWRVHAKNASDLVHNGYSCNGAQAWMDFSTVSDADVVAGWYGYALEKVGYHTAITWGKDWDSRGRGTRIFRRGLREWLALSFGNLPDGTGGPGRDHLFHGRLTLTIAPAPCDGLSDCGLYVFSGSLGT
jgi:hypothetical protein